MLDALQLYGMLMAAYNRRLYLAPLLSTRDVFSSANEELSSIRAGAQGLSSMEIWTAQPLWSAIEFSSIKTFV